MSSMPIYRAVGISMDKFIISTVEPCIKPPRAGKRVHLFFHKSSSLVVFDGEFGNNMLPSYYRQGLRQRELIYSQLKTQWR